MISDLHFLTFQSNSESTYIMFQVLAVVGCCIVLHPK